MARPLPILAESIPYSLDEVLSKIRETIERATDPFPTSMPDYELYMKVREWGQNPQYCAVIQGVLKARLGLPFPYNHKAVMLLQALPISSHIALLDQLKPLTSDETPKDLITHLATEIHSNAAAEKSKGEQQAGAKDTQWKWDVWCEHYGKPDSDWQPLPTGPEPEWGLWAIYPVDRDTWWALPKEGEDEK
ncbi:hypothetical protein BCR39DRAFT_559525 [Naematelia encephala]|uniref:Uncharacterized protein n=1 Tax=Naematelia encephala TaxID=71784 RepID=A0A1Y2B196_9TREE|nr:hypothetical protein BCR39DRAFT_559525 [Naematelia encephala]